MLIEITGVALDQGIVHIFGTDCSEENLQRIERCRMDSFEELEFVLDTKEPAEFRYLYSWLKGQKAARSAETYGAALRSTIGTVTNLSGKYRSWE